MFRLILLNVIFITNSMSYSQVDSTGVRWFKHIANLVREDRINELSALVSYPLERENPLPDIKSKEAFVLYYPILFDSTFKAIILNADTNSI